MFSYFFLIFFSCTTVEIYSILSNGLIDFMFCKLIIQFVCLVSSIDILDILTVFYLKYYEFQTPKESDTVNRDAMYILILFVQLPRL